MIRETALTERVSAIILRLDLRLFLVVHRGAGQDRGGWYGGGEVL